MKKVLQGAIALMLAVVIACGGGDPDIDTAKLNLKNKDYQKALEAVDKAIQLKPDNAYAYYYRGNIYSEWAKATADVSARQEKYMAMREAWNKCVEINNTLPKKGNEVALIDLTLPALWRTEHNTSIELAGADAPTPEQLQTAIAHLKNAQTIAPDTALTPYVLGEVYMMAKDTMNAIASLEYSLKVGGTNYQRAMRLAGIMGSAGKNTEKTELLNALRTSFPDSIGIVQELANTFLATGDTDKAIAVVKELIDKDPSNANYHLVYGTQVYQAVIDLSTDIRKDFDDIFELRRRLNKAKAAARNAPAKSKSSVDSVGIITEILTQKEAGVLPKRAKMAELDAITMAEMKVVIELDPTNHTAYNVVGVVYQNRAAIISAEINSLDALAKDYYERSDALDAKAKDTLREGLPYYEKAAELKPENKDYWNSLFRLYTSLNMMDKANEAYDKANQ